MNSQRILFVGGLLLFLSSLAYGVFYDGYLAVENHRAVIYNLDMALNMAAKGDLTMASAFANEFGLESQTHDIQSRISLHLAVAGAMATTPLWILPKLDISERLKRVLALLIIFGGAVLAAGDFMQALGLVKYGFYTVLAGYTWMALGLLGYFFYGLLAMWLNQEPRTKKRGG